ncbi:MAG: hypothetical protein QXV17_06555 [Candidatus Micrarchaeaceae archaeon]
MEIPRNQLQDILYYFDPSAPTLDQILSVQLSINSYLKQILDAISKGASAPPSSQVPVISTIGVTVSTLTAQVNFPPWLYPTANSKNFYVRDAVNIVGVVSTASGPIVTSSLVTVFNVPKNYVGFLGWVATDDNSSSFHQFIFDGEKDNTFSGTASPQANQPVLQIFPPKKFLSRVEYWASNFNTGMLTYQGIFIGWFTPKDEV